METIINAWGGEGLLSSAALTVIGSMGLLAGAPNQKIHLRILDFAMNSGDDVRRRQLAEAYTKYYSLLFGRDPEIVFDEIEMKNIVKQDITKTVLGKTKNAAALALGCSASDMKLNIENGIYGKPWIGEIYYSDSDFSKLYEDFAEGSEVIIINCGGYRGGGTAATFIPIENMYPLPLITYRYTVVSGPSTRFVYTVKIPHPEIYYINSFRLNELSIFYVPEVLKLLSNISVPEGKDEKHRQNIEYLVNEYKKIKSEEYDYSNLDPQYYSARFLDRIFSDSSRVSAVFINLKTDGDQLLPLDQTSENIEPDLQTHRLHISSLLNALSIREIIFNYQKYSGGKVYSFGTNADDYYNSDTLFDMETKEKFWQFIAMTILMCFFVHDSFLLPSLPAYSKVTEKWSKKRNGGIMQRTQEIISIIMNNELDNDNILFSKMVLEIIEQFIFGYIRPVILALKEFDLTSDQVHLFNNDVAFVIDDILREDLNKGGRFSTENDPYDYIPSQITNIMMEISWFSNKERIKLYQDTTGLFRYYVSGFPEYYGEKDIEGAQKYFNEIVRYTMNKAADFIKR